MLNRLTRRTLLWMTMAASAAAAAGAATGAAALLSGGAVDAFSPPVGPWDATAGSPRDLLSAVAPWLSIVLLAGAALAGRRLQRRLSVAADAARGAGRDAETSLTAARQLHEAMHASVDGILLLRVVREESGAVRDFEIVDANPSAASLLRRTPSDLPGRLLRRDLSMLSAEGLVARYANAMVTGEIITEEIRVSRRHFDAGWLFHQAVPTADGMALTLRNITAPKRETQRLKRVSMTDDLTQLHNRRGFLMLAEQQLRIARRQGKDAVLMYVDMDAFKALNDQHGHAEGDRALVAVARLLRAAMRDSDVVGRMGGDEFTIMALDADRFAAHSIQRRIEEHLAQLNATGQLAAPLSLTIGFTRVRPTDHAPLAELLARADSLLYERKRRRRLTSAAKDAASARASGERRRARLGGASRPDSPSSPLSVPRDIAAMARAATVAAASRVAVAPNGAPYTPTRMG